MSDWRKQGQEKYLKGKTLVFRKYNPFPSSWDHDHCEFCQAKLAISGGKYNEGYCTEEKYHWICPDCFNDFVDEFQWKIREPPKLS